MDTEESNLKHNGIPKTSPRTGYSITNALKSAIINKIYNEIYQNERNCASIKNNKTIVFVDIRLQSSPDSSKMQEFPKATIDKINYLVALISEFAKAHQLSTQAAYLYLNQFKGLNFADEFYDVNHTLSFDNVVEDLTLYCKKNGGQLA